MDATLTSQKISHKNAITSRTIIKEMNILQPMGILHREGSKIEQPAQAILDARAKYPECSLADLYDDNVMPVELRRAHQDNDRAVMAAYGFETKMSESDCVAQLLEQYQALTKGAK